MLPENSTIVDVCASAIAGGERTQKEEYVRRVLGHMSACRRKNRDANVRIGIIGEGKSPNYRIEWGNESCPEIFGVFRGIGHVAFEDESALQQLTWSRKTASFIEVQALLGRLRNFTH